MNYERHIDFLAHMLDESNDELKCSRNLNEAYQISDKDNFVVIQCLFRNLLTGKQLDVSTKSLPPKLRKGLDFELFYRVDNITMKRLLDTSLLVSNCVNAPAFTSNEQIVDILSPFKPIGGFITNSFAERITGEVMSSESTRILKQWNAQRPGCSVFRFSFYYSDSSTIYAMMPVWNNSGELIDKSYTKHVNSLGKIDKIMKYDDDGNEEIHTNKEFTVIYPFVLGGYWQSFQWNEADKSFEQSEVVKSSVVAKLRKEWPNKQLTMFRQFVNGTQDIDISPLTDFLESAVSTIQTSGKDLRNTGDRVMSRDDYRNVVAFHEDEAKNLDKTSDTIEMPASDCSQNEFNEWCEKCNKIYGQNVYEYFVPDEHASIPGMQRDVDDWDEYTVNWRDTIDEERFWEKLADKIADDVDDPSFVKVSDLIKMIDKYGEQIAEEALDDYEPNDEQLTHRGRMHWGGYYPG